jgi:hypothetical protein
MGAGQIVTVLCRGVQAVFWLLQPHIFLDVAPGAVQYEPLQPVAHFPQGTASHEAAQSGTGVGASVGAGVGMGPGMHGGLVHAL